MNVITGNILPKKTANLVQNASTHVNCEYNFRCREEHPIPCDRQDVARIHRAPSVPETPHAATATSRTLNLHIVINDAAAQQNAKSAVVTVNHFT